MTGRGGRAVGRLPRQGLLGALLFAAPIISLPAPASQEIHLTIADIGGPGFSAESVSARLSGPGLSRLELHLGRLALAGRAWRDLSLACADTRIEPSAIRCGRGRLVVHGKSVPVSFAYLAAAKKLEFSVTPAPGEQWRVVAARLADGSWQATVTINGGRVSRLAPWLHAQWPRIGQGRLEGVVKLRGAAGGLAAVDAAVSVAGLAFSNASGLHAGDKVGGALRLRAQRRGGRWDWRADLDWRKGEVFWQPLYFAEGGRHLTARGSLDARSVTLERGTLALDGVGSAELAGSWDRAGGRLADLTLSAGGLDLGGLYRVLLQPFLQQTALADLRVRGAADLEWQYRDGATRKLDLRLAQADIEDGRGRFALHGLNASVPWTARGPARAELAIGGAQLLHIPLGTVRVPVEMNGSSFALGRLELPVLGGRLTLEDFRASLLNGSWQWHFSGGLTPVSMEDFTRALGLPVMHGTLSGVIPGVDYRDRTVTVDGALLFKVFDGTAVVKDLVIYDPLGRAPRLNANLDMRDLDLGLLTRTFSFGNIEGRVDAQVNDLALSAWQPVRFDARVASSAGDYPRKISQKAVENISALGGAGAAAAIQRSFLRFFHEFRYAKLGLSCVLRNGVCLMGGVERAPQGYVIVKGGGIPAITVIGYNRYVDWDELLERLKRITQGNVQPVVH